VEVEAEEDPDADEESRVTLFRSVRELLFNVVKHAGVTSARIRLGRTADGRVCIVVSDEGAGFNPETLRTRDRTEGGFGLLSLRERLDLLGGRLEVESAPGRGSRFTIIGPVPQPAGPATPVATPAAPSPPAAKRRPDSRPRPARKKASR
jgi:signal transduction histidine kinase